MLPEGVYTVQRGTKPTEDRVTFTLTKKKRLEALGYVFQCEPERLEGWTE